MPSAWRSCSPPWRAASTPSGVCVTDIANINKAKKAIKKAFQKQMNGEGFTFIEVLSTCPTNWGMTPLKAVEWLKDNMVPYYPLGVIKETAPETAEVK